MIFFLQILFLFILILCNSFLPGFFLIRKFQCSNLEKITLSLGLSLFIIYLLSFLFFILKVPFYFHFGFSISIFIVLIFQFKNTISFFKTAHVYQPLLGFLILLSFGFLINTLITTFGGGHWMLDWHEHFHRTEFWLKRLDVHTRFLSGYSLTARPPMMNLIASHFCAQLSFRFEIFQIVYLTLNLFVFFPFLLLVNLFQKNKKNLILIGVFFLLACPHFWQNASYTWSRSLTNFFVLTGFYFYLSAWKNGKSWPWIVAFVSLAMAALVHYSAGPYVVILTLHYLILFVYKKRFQWKEISLIFILCSLVLATWFLWSTITFGGKDVLTSNTSFAGYKELFQPDKVKMYAQNFYWTLIPHFFRNVSNAFFTYGNPWSYLRDYFFLLYNNNLIFGLGSLGGILLILHFIFHQNIKTSWDRFFFWFYLVFSTMLVTSLVTPRPEEFGSAHACLQPLALIGLGFLASQFVVWKKPIQILAFFGLVFDLFMGVLLHFYFENLIYQAQKLTNGKWGISGNRQFNWVTRINLEKKLDEEVIFLGDHFHGVYFLSYILLVILLTVVLVFFLKKTKILFKV